MVIGAPARGTATCNSAADTRAPGRRLSALFDSSGYRVLCGGQHGEILAAAGRVGGVFTVAFASDVRVKGGAMTGTGCAVSHWQDVFVPGRPGGDQLRRLERDPAEYHRRAGLRPAQGVTAGLSPAPVRTRERFQLDDFAAAHYDEFGFLESYARHEGIPWNGPLLVSRRTVAAAGGQRLSGLVWGAAEPEIVLLHGPGPPAGAVDLPGHGHSDWRDDADYRRRARAVRARAVRAPARAAPRRTAWPRCGMTWRP
jgi:hypothetical protein